MIPSTEGSEVSNQSSLIARFRALEDKVAAQQKQLDELKEQLEKVERWIVFE